MAVKLEPVEGTEDMLLAVLVAVGRLVWSDGIRSHFEKIVPCVFHRIHPNSYK